MKKGVSLIALLSTVIVLGIITNLVIVSGYNIITETEKKEFVAEVISLQKVIKERIVAAGEEKVIGEKVLLDTTEGGLVDQMILEPFVEENKKELYKIKLENMGIDNLRRGNKNHGENDIYLYSKATEKVYYKNGEKIGGSFYYTYSSDLVESVESSLEDYYPKIKELKFNEIKAGVSVAEDITTKWKPSDIYIKINPKKEFKYVRKKITGGLEPLNVRNQVIEYGDNKIIRVETSKLPEDQYSGTIAIGIDNYNIEYKLKYLDKKLPTIIIGDKDVYYVKDESGSNLYIDLKGAVKDNSSGIKIVKYAYGEKTVDYFQNEGTILLNDRIQIERNTKPIKITIYAEDNAGNKAVFKYTVPDAIVKESGI